MAPGPYLLLSRPARSPSSGAVLAPSGRPATPAHPFPAIFGNFHPFIRPNNTLARGHLKGKSRFPQEKVRTGIRKMMILFHTVNVLYTPVHAVIAPAIYRGSSFFARCPLAFLARLIASKLNASVSSSPLFPPVSLSLFSSIYKFFNYSATIIIPSASFRLLGISLEKSATSREQRIEDVTT